jgi:hypothetical protein
MSVHDAAYLDTLEVFGDGQWVKAHLSKDGCHSN